LALALELALIGEGRAQRCLGERQADSKDEEEHGEHAALDETFGIHFYSFYLNKRTDDKTGHKGFTINAFLW